MSYEDSLKNRWSHMHERCDNPKLKQFASFGGRGIKVCSEWNNFEAFREWSLANGYAPNLEISRIDINGDFEPSNCRYATAQEQCNNRRTSRIETYHGVTDTAINLCRIFDKDYDLVRKRLFLGKTIDEAMNTDRKYIPPRHAVKQQKLLAQASATTVQRAEAMA